MKILEGCRRLPILNGRLSVLGRGHHLYLPAGPAAQKLWQTKLWWHPSIAPGSIHALPMMGKRLIGQRAVPLVAAAPGKQQCREEQAQRHDGSPPALLLLRFCCLRLCAWIRAEAPGNSHDARARKVRLLAAERCDEGATKASGSGSAPHAAPRHLQHAAKPVHSADQLKLAELLESNVMACRCEVFAQYCSILLADTPPHRNSRCLISKRISIIGLNRKERPNLSAENDRAGIGASPESHGT